MTNELWNMPYDLYQRAEKEAADYRKEENGWTVTWQNGATSRVTYEECPTGEWPGIGPYAWLIDGEPIWSDWHHWLADLDYEADPPLKIGQSVHLEAEA